MYQVYAPRWNTETVTVHGGVGWSSVQNDKVHDITTSLKTYAGSVVHVTSRDRLVGLIRYLKLIESLSLSGTPAGHDPSSICPPDAYNIYYQPQSARRGHFIHDATPDNPRKTEAYHRCHESTYRSKRDEALERGHGRVAAWGGELHRTSCLTGERDEGRT